MQYYNTNDKTPRMWAAAATVLYALLLALVFLLVSVDFGVSQVPDEEGILINFGTTETGEGDIDMQAADEEAMPQTASADAADRSETTVTDKGDVEVQKAKPIEKPKKDRADSPSPQRTETSVAEEKRQVNTKALFPGRSVENAARSEGNSSGAGNQGDPSGSPDGSHEGTGQGTSGMSYDLSGRSVVGSLPKPVYAADVSGKVIIDVTVDASGRVTSAAFHPQGSTTSNDKLVTAARNAALRARFSESESLMQGGTITYIFRMN